MDKFLNPKYRNICLLYSKNKSILAYNPVDHISTNNLDEFFTFTEKHKKNKLIGYLSYDLAYELHKIEPRTEDFFKLPKIYFFAFKEWEEFENIEFPKVQIKSPPIFKPTMSKEAYLKAFNKIKNYIIEGDIYQINLTHLLQAETKIPPRELFLKIIEKNQAEYACYMEGDGFEILSASPERLIKIENGKAETCPIKGTRPRNTDPIKDNKLKQELLDSEKETAELNMITDLLRNDLGKISKANTVKVEGHRIIKKLPTVWHTYSKITSEINTDKITALISMLPGGSITGCPKKRAIEIIDEVEPIMRGIYTGNIGYITEDKLDFNIAIRTIIKKGQDLYLQVGGGIVADSDYEKEFQETLDKAKAFQNLL